MSIFDLKGSFDRAEGLELRRSDAGRSRLDPLVWSFITARLLEHERPSIKRLHDDVKAFGRSRKLRAPSRATLYNVADQMLGHHYLLTDLPVDVQAALYNARGPMELPGRQVVFYCLNYGNLRAIQYAASMPWLDLFQAARTRGWRVKSRGLLDAIFVARGIRRR